MYTSALQPWKGQLTGIGYSTAAQASSAHCPRNGLWTTELYVGIGRSHAHSGLTPTHRHLIVAVLPVPSAGVAMAIMVRQRHLSNMF